MRRNKTKAVEAEVIDESGKTVKYGIAHLLPYLPPWGLAVAVGIVGVIAHLLWGDSPVGMGAASAGITLAGVAVTAMAWRAGAARGAMTQIHATISIGLAVLWVLAALITGPGRPVADIWLIGASTVAVTWNIRKGLRGGGDGSGWAEFATSTKLAKARVQHPTINGAQVGADLALAPGQTIADVQGETGRIASALRVPANAVRVVADPDDASRGTMTVTTMDMLRQRVAWPGPSAVGGSIARPIPVGTREDGTLAQFWLPGDPKAGRNATLLLINGMAGSGKTKGTQIAVNEIASRHDAAVIACDPVKSDQSLLPVRGALAGAVTTMAGAKALITRIRDAARYRAGELGRRGYGEWVEGCGLPYLVFWLEEAAAYLPGSDRFAEVAREIRSTGLGLMVSLQRTTHRGMHTDARQQFGGGWCFGVDDLDDATYVLSDHTIDAGARPDVWGTRKPGCSYLEAPGIPEEYWAMPMRTFDAADDVLKRGAEMAVPTAVDAGTAKILGDVLDAPTTSTAVVAAPVTAVVPTVQIPRQRDSETASVDVPNPFTGSIDELASDIDGDDLDEHAMTMPSNPEPGFLDDVDTSAEIPADDEDLTLAASGVRSPALSPRDAEAALVKHLNELFDTGHPHVSPAKLAELRRGIGRSRTWFSRKLADFADAGALNPTGESGTYELVARITTT
ncbi:hypothetical protein [Phytomonospora endophytica]|uniref:Uncharacterized protein n=1 Tax=Phytomonospora endophytica TaxID=714109 RepID=A0A841FXH2_9ACTN|nr:hypothetical protein [Phytomonospora endophytica]MBB6038232.1 hypothetical protein [Phytomonospora endophytica]GIG67308.1 sporulation protein SsgA [Phytomonospora endophytica]